MWSIQRLRTIPSGVIRTCALGGAACFGLALLVFVRNPAQAQAAGPVILAPNLGVRTVADGLDTPISMAFLGEDDILVLEKNTGKVQRIVNGSVQSTVLDLAVNSASERGLLGIALHPVFPANPAVFLYWTESSTGVDTDITADVPLLGNRVDRFLWDGSTLTFEQNLIQLRAFQADEGQPLRGNHNGGVIRFGPDSKLSYTSSLVTMGDGDKHRTCQTGRLAPGFPTTSLEALSRTMPT